MHRSFASAPPKGKKPQHGSGQTTSELLGSAPLLCYRGADRLHRRLGIFDFDDQTRVLLVIQLENDRAIRIVHVVEHDATLLVESTRCQYSWNLSAQKTDTVPPSARRLAIRPHRGHVLERKFEMAAKRPQLVPSLHLETEPVAFDGDLNHTLERGTSEHLRQD